MDETRPFDRKAAKPGDRLALASNTAIRMRFRGIGHDGMVVADLEPDCLPQRVARSVLAKPAQVVTVSGGTFTPPAGS